MHNTLEEQKLKVLAAKIPGAIMPPSVITTGLDVNTVSRNRKVVDAYNNDPFILNKMSFGFGRIMLGLMESTPEHAGEFPLPLLLMDGSID